MKLEDGQGTGKLAKVDDNHRLHVDAISEVLKDAETEQGNSYNFNTDDITLTNANKTTLFYFKNSNIKS